MSKIICCSKQMSKELSGISAIEYVHSIRGKPYKIWQASKYECGECGKIIISDFDKAPWARRSQDAFDGYIKRAEKRAETIKFY